VFFLGISLILALFLLVAWVIRHRHSSRTAGLFRFLLVLLLYAVVAAVLLNSFMTSWGFRGNMRWFGFEEMLTFSAEKPYVYRVLTPTLINFIASIVPNRVVETNRSFFLEQSPLINFMKFDRELSLATSVKYHVAYYYLFACLLLWLFALRRLTILLFPSPLAFIDFAPAMAAIFLPLTFIHGGYMYDFPELLLLTLSLHCLLQSRWHFFYPLFVLSLLNKESNFLIILYFIALQYRKMPRAELTKHLAAIAAISGLHWVSLHLLFRANAGSDIYLQVWHNISHWLSPESYFMFFTPYSPGIAFPRGGNLLLIFMVLFLVCYRWREKPEEIRRVFLFTLPVILLLFLCCSHSDETRNLSLIFPPFYLLAFHTVRRLYAEPSSGGP